MSDFETRPDAKCGYRHTCKECRRASKNATNRRWYQAHREQESEKSARYRQCNRRELQLANMAYHLKYRERRNAYNRDYYRRNRERLIDAAIARRRRVASLDYGWQWGARHDVAQFAIWTDRQSEAGRLVDLFLERLPERERQWCERFLDEGTEMPEGVIESIRRLLSGMAYLEGSEGGSGCA